MCVSVCNLHGRMIFLHVLLYLSAWFCIGWTLCLPLESVCVCVCVCVGGGGGVRQTIHKAFRIHNTQSTQNPCFVFCFVFLSLVTRTILWSLVLIKLLFPNQIFHLMTFSFCLPCQVEDRSHMTRVQHSEGFSRIDFHTNIYSALTALVPYHSHLDQQKKVKQEQIFDINLEGWCE